MVSGGSGHVPAPFRRSGWSPLAPTVFFGPFKRYHAEKQHETTLIMGTYWPSKWKTTYKVHMVP
jgi:hypothetical protein